MATFAAQGTLPAPGASMEAAPLTDTFNHIINTINGNNLDRTNVDYTSTDGIMVMDQDQTVTSTKSWENTAAAAGGVREVAQFGIDPGSGTAADNDGGRLTFYADDDGGNETDIARFDWVLTDASDGSEDGRLDWSVMTAGTLASELQLSGASLNPTTDAGLALGTASLRWGTVYADTLGDTGQALGVAATTLSFDAASTIDTSGNNNLTLSAGTASLVVTAGDVTIYDDNNNADTSLAIGTSATESLSIQVLNGSSNKTAEEVKFVTATASSTANHGKMTFNVDGTDVLSIDDDGIAMGAARTIETTSGAMTLTSAAAATWSTSAGALTISGNAGVNIQEDGTDVIAIDTSRAVALTLGSDATGDIIYRNASGKLARLAVGSDGEVLKLASGLPSWAADTAGAVSSVANGSDNRVTTFSGSDTLNGEANLTFNGSALQVTGTLTVGVDDTGHDVKFFGATSGKYILWDEAQDTLQFVDNTNLTFGTGNDADIFYDGTDLNISPAVVGSGDIVVNGASMEFDDSEGVTFGTGKDATIQYDGSDLVISPRAVGSGDVSVSGGGITVAGTSTLNSDVVVNDNSNNRLLLLDNDGTGTALEITQDAVAASTDYALHVHSTVAQTSGELVWIDHDHASSTSDVMRLRNDGTGRTAYLTQNGVLASNKYGLHVYSDAAQTNEGLALFQLDNASSNKPVIEVNQDGSGPAIQVVQNTHSRPIILVESATASGGTAAAGAAFHSGYIESIGANSTATIWSGWNIQSGFMILCIYDGNSGANSTALIEFSTHSSAYEGTIMSQSGDDTIAITTSDVSGSTGTSGQFTVSIRAGIIEVENRLHAVDNTRVGWWIFSH